jgi:hypothetical protein
MVELAQTVNLQYALDELERADYGSHFLLTYRESETWSALCSTAAKKYLDLNGMVLVIPFYKTTSKTRQYLSEKISDFKRYEQEGSIAVLDSIKAYFSDIGLMTFVDGLLKHAQSKGKYGLSVFADMGSFRHMNRMHQLLEHEISLPSRYDASLRGFCMYNEGDFSKFTDAQKQSIYEHHGKNLLVNQ